jgi:hypothetical protein
MRIRAGRNDLLMKQLGFFSRVKQIFVFIFLLLFVFLFLTIGYHFRMGNGSDVEECATLCWYWGLSLISKWILQPSILLLE